jgi:hypothetical protein
MPFLNQKSQIILRISEKFADFGIYPRFSVMFFGIGRRQIAED